MRLAVDMSSLLWTCLSVGNDAEGKKIEFNGRLVQVNTAAYGYEFCINSLLSSMAIARCQPKDIIMVFEGMNSKSSRLAINAEYKATRSERPPELYSEFSDLQDMLRATFGKLGALALTQENCEGDDTLGWLAENSEDDITIVSNDGDLCVLYGTNKYGAQVHTLIGGAVNTNKYGDWPNKYVTVYKALVGDSRDNIKGIKGFGQAAWDAMYKEFGDHGLEQLHHMGSIDSMEELIPDMDKSAMIKRLVEGGDQFLNSFKLAKLHPEWVNTLRYPLKFEPGLIKGKTGDERLTQYEGTESLITATKWNAFTAWAREHIETHASVALDIETSTPDESTAWLEAQGKDDSAAVDVIGSELTGMSLTFGANYQHTVYIPIDHKDTDNVNKDKVRDFIGDLSSQGVEFIIQNYSFEGTVLFNEWGEHWKDNGFAGLLPNALDTKLEASYVNENESLGLKKLSKMYFNYDQVEYKAVTTIDGVSYKMRELTGKHVKSYGCDDTICTASLHNFFKLFMQLEHTWKVYLDVEIDAMYLHTQSFIHGVKCDVAKSKELEAIDAATAVEAWKVLEAYLLTKNWDGTIPPVYTAESLPAQLKEAFQIVTGSELVTSVRMLPKLAAAMSEQGSQIMADFVLNADWVGLTNYVRSKWTAKPVLNVGSPKQMQNLLYNVMSMPVRVFNKPTPIARKAGEVRGSPKTDELAFAYAKSLDATPEQKPVLEALRLIKMVNTRQGLYYKTYPYLVHWKTGRLHSSHNQCATNTRRASSSAPNMQQMPKHPKIEGQPARFREVIVPHKKNAVIVSMDFAAQELRVIADYSQDENMLACFVGVHLKDMHALTGLGIAKRKEPVIEWSYELFADILQDNTSPMYKLVKECRTLGKKVNFTVEYGAMAPKLAATMLITETEAQAYIDAKEAAFERSGEWKVEVIEEAKSVGIVKTMLGAVRHLAPAFRSRDRYEASKAERQAVNTKIQGSCAEMTKLAEGRMWAARLEQRFDCEIIGPIHDECIASCTIEDLHEFIPAMHECMVQKYSTMQVPILSSISLGPSFGVQLEIGEQPTREAIAYGIEELYKLINKELTCISQ
jgi:DNA polymerase I-like protein with 3'-5' exonuclease and polymerase domains/5'-3' exonuclease